MLEQAFKTAGKVMLGVAAVTAISTAFDTAIALTSDASGVDATLDAVSIGLEAFISVAAFGGYYLARPCALLTALRHTAKLLHG